MNTKAFPISLLSGLILLSLVTLAACSPPVALAQPVTVEVVEEQASRSWEISVDDIAAAREAAETLSQNSPDVGEYPDSEDLLRSWEISTVDIAAARRAALALSQTNTVVEMEFDAADLVSGELDTSDIYAARQAAHYLEAAERINQEISAADISVARWAALALTQARTEAP